MPDIRTLYADNDFDVGEAIVDGDGDPATGLTLLAYISATKERTTAVAIDPTLSLTLTETPASSGTYVGVIQGSAIQAKLCTPIAPATTDYRGKLVYLIKKAGTDYFSHRTCVVKDYRVAE